MRAVDFHAYLIEDEPDCAVSIDSVAYADLDGDGREEALVVASTCNTGTAGPDVHAVYRLDDAGKPVELKIDESASTFEGKTIYGHLVGNRNYDLDHDQICANEDLARADRELAAVYTTLLSRLAPDEKQRLRDEQRAWLRTRDGCTYKWVDDCVRKEYTARLAALKAWHAGRRDS